MCRTDLKLFYLRRFVSKLKPFLHCSANQAGSQIVSQKIMSKKLKTELTQTSNRYFSHSSSMIDLNKNQFMASTVPKLNKFESRLFKLCADCENHFLTSSLKFNASSIYF